jgi:hypothetical protein
MRQKLLNGETFLQQTPRKCAALLRFMKISVTRCQHLNFHREIYDLISVFEFLIDFRVEAHTLQC